MNVVNFSTLGQTSEWQILIKWVIERDIEDSFRLLVDASFIHDRVDDLATIIDRLSSEACIEKLSQWSKSSTHAHHIQRVVIAYKNNKPSNVISKIHPDGKPARKQYFSTLTSLYLVSALTERIPMGKESDKRWFETFRLWLVVKAVYAASYNDLQDSYLRELFRFVRIAADKQGDKLILLNKLKVDANGYFPFVRALELKVRNLLLETNHNPTDLNFLRSLQKICNNELSPEDFFVVKPMYAMGRSLNNQMKLSVDENDKFTDSETNDVSSDFIVNVDEHAENDLTIEFNDDPSQPLALRLLNGNSVLLNTIEELQFLPWSWNKPNPEEIQVLLQFNNELLNSDKEEEQLLGAIIWISLKTARSLRRTLNIQIGIIGEEWALNLQSKKLVRSQPKHKNAWQPATDQEKAWVLPLVDNQEISVPDSLIKVVKKAIIRVQKAEYLKELWNESAWGGIEKLFYDLLRDKAPRVTPGMLGNYLPNKIFHESDNDKLSRLLASHPRTGLPPASAYAAWLADEYPQIFSELIPVKNLNKQNNVLAGSCLYPAEPLLVKAINKAGKKIEEIREKGDLIEYHNQLTGYIYTMLLASTGCRPIIDLVESIGQIDVDNRYLYIDDKSSSQGNKGRLIPIPDGLIGYLVKDYLAHLRIVADVINTVNSSLAEEIIKISQAKHSDKLPFLFMLETEPKLDWAPVSPSKVENLNLFDWPLPSNLFRHRLAKMLPREGVPQEIVDGFLGHLESGLETYGDYSTRIFIEDSAIVRPAVNKLFMQLGFTFPKHQPYLKISNTVSTRAEFKIKIFGSKRRANERKSRIVNAIQSARWEIEKSLREINLKDTAYKEKDGQRNYPLELLNEQQVNELSRSMLFFPSGIPRNDGMLRYTYLIKCINRRVLLTGKKVLLRKSYIFAETYSQFTPISINSQRKYTEIKSAISAIIDSKPPSKFGIKDTELLSVLIFIIENRVADKKMLLKIFLGRQYQIIKLHDQHYLEFYFQENFDSSVRCVKRFPISALCAFWMQKSENKNIKNEKLKNPVSDIFKKILNALSNSNQEVEEITNVEKLIQSLAELVDQVNAIELPGLLTGYLSGRVSSYSYNWPELIRLKSGSKYRFDFEKYQDAFPLVDESDEMAIELPSLGVRGNINEELLKEKTKELFQKVRNTLQSLKLEEGSRAKNNNKYITKLNDLSDSYKDYVSQASLILVDWVKVLLKIKKSDKAFLEVTTVERYFSALSSKFEILAFATSLVDLDDEEITSLYSQIILLAKESDRAYVGERLLSFHQWVRRLGVEEPDWAEVGVPDQPYSVSPGLIFEEDYKNALMLLMQSSTDFDISDRYCALILLLTYRFGLRGNEALGLQMADILKYDEFMVVLVTDNKIRKLKSLASRRQVPLVFELSDNEKWLINWCLDYLSSLPGVNQKTPIFNMHGEPLSLSEKALLKKRVINILKQVTCNPSTTIHHARHSAVNKIAYALYGVMPLYSKECELGKVSPLVAQMLLGTDSRTRRETWASARILGHATRITQMKSYIHFLGDWAGQYANFISTNQMYEPLENVLDIGQYSIESGTLDFKSSDISKVNLLKESVTLLDILQLFNDLGKGMSVERAAVTLGLTTELAQYSFDLLAAVSEKREDIDSINDRLGILHQTKQPVWARFFEYIKSLDDQEIEIDKFKSSDFEIEKLLPMFGGYGQILMRTEPQFRIMQSFMALFNVSPDSFDVLAPKSVDTKFILRAEQHKFRPILIGSNTELGLAYKEYQLDTYVDIIEGEIFEQRCAISFKRVNTGEARNSTQWFCLMMLFITYLKSQSN